MTRPLDVVALWLPDPRPCIPGVWRVARGGAPPQGYRGRKASLRGYHSGTVIVASTSPSVTLAT